MTQFAIFTGPKPSFQNFEFVPSLNHHTKDYVGLALTEAEKIESWVASYPLAEPIDEMCGKAMEPAQLKGNILNTELHTFLSTYITNCKAITFIYGVYSTKIPTYTDSNLFLNVVTQSLSKPPFEIYAKYSAS